MRIVYGKSELQPQEIEWLRGLTYIRTSFCKNLHAKCCMNEEMCIVTSLNLYEFSQVNNNEMGILIQRADDGQLYKGAYEEAQRIIRIGEEVRISLERVTVVSEDADSDLAKAGDAEHAGDQLMSSKMAQKLGLKTPQFVERMTELGFLMTDGDKLLLTPKGEKTGVEHVARSRVGMDLMADGRHFFFVRANRVESGQAQSGVRGFLS